MCEDTKSTCYFVVSCVFVDAMCLVILWSIRVIIYNHKVISGNGKYGNCAVMYFVLSVVCRH